MEPKTVIVYHGNCPDGFGGAYSAWKKFGDTAEYKSARYGKPAPDGLAGNHLYFIDFCYDQEQMDAIKDSAASLTILDHHLGTKEVVESMPEHIFDNDRSGAVIAWEYFHPGTKVPTLLSYVQDGDLYKFKLPDSNAVLTAVYAQPFDFAGWDILADDLENDAKRAALIETGRTYRSYYEILADQIAKGAELVTFEGHTVYLVTAPRAFISDVGHLLYEEQPPFALLAAVRPEGIRVSLRGDGSVDLSKIAQKYGGNGHPGASAFLLTWDDEIPWKPIDNENPVD